ncbi:hypothetical protein, partial [Bacteroides heparinolyticus]|uniref:hypothetical protein n=1 Tax=Prevotella heparinolytica TaxID=28113 RepID=UPI0035A06F2C
AAPRSADTQRPSPHTRHVISSPSLVIRIIQTDTLIHSTASAKNLLDRGGLFFGVSKFLGRVSKNAQKSH